MSAPILLLDAQWRIDRIISVERACELLVQDKAVAASSEIATIMHSPSIEVEIPEVIARAGRVASRHYRNPPCTARRVRQRDHHVCQFVIAGDPCWSKGDSVDHLVPQSRGGASSWLNLVAACRQHNHFKADRSIEEMSDRFGWGLRRTPWVPSHAEMVIASVHQPPEGWEPFLPDRRGRSSPVK